MASMVVPYRHDMGGGEFVLMKDVSAPIFVDGRHWGGLRLAYRAARLDDAGLCRIDDAGQFRHLGRIERLLDRDRLIARRRIARRILRRLAGQLALEPRDPGL